MTTQKNLPTTTLYVTNNKDSGEDSLRDALKQSQASEGGRYDIVFKAPRSAKIDNTLMTGYFTIALKSPLPNIYRNDITINQTNPRSVILVADGASTAPSVKSGSMLQKPNNSDRLDYYQDAQSDVSTVNGSMLYVGDTNYLYAETVRKSKPNTPPRINNKGQNVQPKLGLDNSYPEYDGVNLPNVVINNVAFIRNEAKGGKGGSGGGGGLGAGGGISLIAGDLTVKNSIFQDLSAVGGDGGDGTWGGYGSHVTWWGGYEQKAHWGAAGGDGGLSSIPTRMLDRNNDRSKLWYFNLGRARGGKPGKPGDRFGACENPKFKFITDKEVASGYAKFHGYVKGWNSPVFGKRGQDAGNSGFFGMGGAGGGGGGGAGFSRGSVDRLDGTPLRFGHNKDFWCWASTLGSSRIYPGGDGGVGSNAGLGGGAGAEGGQGGLTHVYNTSGLVVNKGINKLPYLTGYSSGKKALLNPYKTPDRTKGPSGANGLGLGNAIAILNAEANNISNIKTHASLNLDQVSFYNTDNISGSQIWRDSSTTKVALDQVYLGKGRTLNNRKLVDHKNVNALMNTRDGGAKSNVSKYYSKSFAAPIFNGTSVPRVPSVADFSDTILYGTELADQFYVGVENRSTVSGITMDQSDPNNPINKIWKELVPDKKNQLLEQYQSMANRSYVETVFPVLTTAKETVGISEKKEENILEKGFATELTGITTADLLGNPKAAIPAAAIKLIGQTTQYTKEQANLENIKNKLLSENEKNQNEMEEALVANSKISFANLKMDLERTRVDIEDFELGKDIVIFPKPMTENDNVSINAATENENTVVTFKYDTASNKDLPFLEIQPTKSSLEFLETNNIDLVSTVRSMLTTNKESFMLGSRYSNPIRLTVSSTLQGPGSATIFVDRKSKDSNLKSNLKNKEVKIETAQGSDEIFGTDQVENISSGPGDDKIFPGLGDDIINGGAGTDLVSYAVRPMEDGKQPIPVNLVAAEDGENLINATPKYKPKTPIRTRDMTNQRWNKLNREYNAQNFRSTLEYIDNFYLYGDSNIDLSNIDMGESDDTRGYQITTGAGGDLIGSAYNDVFSISFNPAWNPSETNTGFKQTTYVKGGEGDDSLIVNTKNATQKLDLYVTEKGNRTVLRRGVDGFPLLIATDIENFQPIQGLAPSQQTKRPNDVFIKGSNRKDVLFGTSQGDVINGRRGSDILIGNYGNDSLIAGRGKYNILDGGEGDDNYKLARKGKSADFVVVRDGDETIKNFATGTDVIGFANIENLNISKQRSISDSKPADNIIIIPGQSCIKYRNDGHDSYSSIMFDDTIPSGSLGQMPLSNLFGADVVTSIKELQA